MKTLKSMVIGVFLGAGISNCGPDTVNNNYYGSGRTPSSGASGNYTCEDVGRVEGACSAIREPENRKLVEIEMADFCRQYDYTQECIDCIATAPCEIYGDGTPTGHSLVDPQSYCFCKGICGFDGDDKDNNAKCKKWANMKPL